MEPSTSCTMSCLMSNRRRLTWCGNGSRHEPRSSHDDAWPGAGMAHDTNLGPALAMMMLCPSHGPPGSLFGQEQACCTILELEMMILCPFHYSIEAPVSSFGHIYLGLAIIQPFLLGLANAHKEIMDLVWNC